MLPTYDQIDTQPEGKISVMSEEQRQELFTMPGQIGHYYLAFWKEAYIRFLELEQTRWSVRYLWLRLVGDSEELDERRNERAIELADIALANYNIQAERLFELSTDTEEE